MSTVAGIRGAPGRASWASHSSVWQCRHRDVHLLDPADQAQPHRAAAGDPGLGLPARHARFRGAVLRLLRRLVRDRPARGDLLAMLARRLFARFVVFAVAFTVMYVAAALLGLLTL